MTIKVTVENCEKAGYADLRVTVREVAIVNGEVKERNDVEEIKAGEKRIYHVYSARSL